MLRAVALPTIAAIGGIPLTQKGAANGVAALDASGKVPPSESIFASLDVVNQNANIGATTLYAVPAAGAGLYVISMYAVVTQAATTSSTLPNVGILWTDNDTNVPLSAVTATPTNTANALGAFGNGSIVVSARNSTNIQYQTSNYASVGGTVMLYAVHLRVQYIG